MRQITRTTLGSASALLLLATAIELRADEPRASLSPKPKMSIHVSSELLDSLFGVTDAAIEGVATALHDHHGEGDAAQLTAEQLSAVKQVLQHAKGVVKRVQLRVYEGRNATTFDSLLADHESGLESQGWEQVVAVDDEHERVRVALRSEAGAVREARVLASGGAETVQIDAELDVTPDRARELGEAVTKIALDLGLEKQLERAVQRVKVRVERAPR